MTPPKIKVGVSKPRKARVTQQPENLDRNCISAGCRVEMRQAQPVFRTNKLLQFFWTLHPTTAAIDATYKYFSNKGMIRMNPGSPALSHYVTRAEKLAAIREVLGRSDRDVAFDI